MSFFSKITTARIGDLEIQLSLIRNTTDAISVLQGSFDDISDRQAVLDTYFSLTKNNSEKIEELLLERETDNATIWQHETTLLDMKNRLAIIEGSSIREEPLDAFYSIGVGIVPVLSEDVLVFPTVQLDEAGLYDDITGKYNVTSDGIYMFYATLCVDKDKMIQVEFIADQDRIGMLTTSTSDRSNCASSTAMARLQKGAEVYLRVVQTWNFPSLLNDFVHFCTFSGQWIGA